MRLSELIANLQRMKEPGSDPEVIIECGFEAYIKEVYASSEIVYIEAEEC